MLHQVERLLGISVQVDDDDVVARIEQLRHVVQLGIGTKLACDGGLGAESDSQVSASRLLGANQGNGQHAGSDSIGILGKGGHYHFVTPWTLLARSQGTVAGDFEPSNYVSFFNERGRT